MPRYYTQIWSLSKYDWLADPDVRAGNVLDHTAGNQFRKRGIQRGDFVYIVAVKKKHLHLIGKMQVEDIYSEEEAKKLLGTGRLWEPNLWRSPDGTPAKDHLIAKQGTETRMYSSLVVPNDLAKKLTFITEQGYTTLGSVSAQKLQTVRQLTPESAQKLDTLLEDKSNIPVAPSKSQTSESYQPPTRESKPKQKHLTKCNICGVSVREDRLTRHIAKVHSPHSKTTITATNRPTEKQSWFLEN
jgi:hypothetical protein